MMSLVRQRGRMPWIRKQKMKKKEIERLKLKLRAEKDPAKVNGSKEQPSVVPRQGLAKVQQPRRRGEV